MKPFSEKQKFTQIWLWVLVGVVLAISLITLFVSMPPEQRTTVYIAAIIAPSIVVAMFLLVLSLTTEIDQSGIAYRFSPLHFSTRKIAWDTVQRAYVREYRPIVEFGGWGIRYGGKSGWAYNVKGGTGIQLELKDGSKILIGTQLKFEAEKVLTQYGFGK